MAGSFSIFQNLFFTKKLARANLINNELLLQILKKVEVLTKTLIEQLQIIKRLEKKIDKLIKKLIEKITSNFKGIIVSKVAKIASINKVFGF